MARLEIAVVPALSDNYVYLAHDADNGTTICVDPAEAAPVEKALAERGWKLTHILNTHHHGDHTDGNAALKAAHGAELIGPKAETARISGMDRTVAEGDTIDLGGHVARIFETPGHTTGHISVWFEADGALFSGDTLFPLGCGRMFEGNPPMFWASLSKLKALPDDTLVYSGHEYTQSNARFALSVDGDNAELVAYAREIDDKRAKGQATNPTDLGREKRTNPFLRADDPGLAAAVGRDVSDPALVFAEVRKRKDNF
jgi:hydroxyacylglutathione hydrolase